MACLSLGDPDMAVIFVLYSIHNVMKAEKILKDRKVAFDTIPVPKEISSDCGMAIEGVSTEATEIKQALIKSGIDIKGMYLKTADGYEEANDG